MLRQVGDQEGLTFTDYKPAKLSYGKQHPDAVVETASLAAVEPPDVTYELHLDDQVEDGTLSGLQLESIVYACQRHEQLLPDGCRAGFFIGDGTYPISQDFLLPSMPERHLQASLDTCKFSGVGHMCSQSGIACAGAGVGKGRTIAGLIMENWRCKRKRHLWLTIGTDLRIDSRRDLDDIGATDIPLHPLNKLPYGQLDSDKVWANPVLTTSGNHLMHLHECCLLETRAFQDLTCKQASLEQPLM